MTPFIASGIVFAGFAYMFCAILFALRRERELDRRKSEMLSLTLEEDRGTARVLDYQVLFTRHASYVIWNQLGNDRNPVLAALERFIVNTAPHTFQPRRPIFLSHDHPNGRVQYVFAADEHPQDPERLSQEPDASHDRHLVVFAVQPQRKRTVPPLHGNCHLTTEMFQAEQHSLISTSIEFALGHFPTKRLNFTADANGQWARVRDDDNEPIIGFKHFMSASYSRHGLAVLDFVLTVLHKPTADFPEKEWTQKKYIARLVSELEEPTHQIWEELERDKHNNEAPSGISNLEEFFSVIRTQVAQSVLTNLAIFDVEVKSNVNPPLKRHRFLNKVQPPQ